MDDMDYLDTMDGEKHVSWCSLGKLLLKAALSIRSI
jgi:hypothetical protein